MWKGSLFRCGEQNESITSSVLTRVHETATVVLGLPTGLTLVEVGRPEVTGVTAGRRLDTKVVPTSGPL